MNKNVLISFSRTKEITHRPNELSKNMISFIIYTKYKYNLCTKMYTLKIH